MKTSGLLLALLFLSFGLQAADPQWIYGNGLDKYRADKFITSVGEGNSSEDARKNAFSRLAEQLKVSISSQSDIKKEYKSTSEDFSQKESMNIQISTAVDLENIEGIKIAETYFQQKSKTYYAFAVLDKVKNATNLGFKIENHFEQVRSQQEQVKKLLAKGENSEGMGILLQTSKLFRDISRDIELHQLFANPGMTSLVKQDALNLITEFDQFSAQVFRKVKIKTIAGNPQTGSPELGVSEPYQVLFTLNGQPLKRVPVMLVTETEGSVIDADKKTSSRGELSVKVRSFPYSDKSENKIKVKLDFYDELFINDSPFAELVILLSQKSEISILLKSKIKSRYNDYLYLTVNDGLASVLSEQNYNVITEDNGSDVKPDYIIDVQASAADLPGLSGIKFSKMNGVIHITSGKTKRKLKTIRIRSDATKAGALSNEIAEEKSTSLMVDAVKSELLDTLERNLGRN